MPDNLNQASRERDMSEDKWISTYVKLRPRGFTAQRGLATSNNVPFIANESSYTHTLTLLLPLGETQGSVNETRGTL